MQIAAEQGTFMAILAAAIGARSAVEVGTFTGYSALCVARALPADGKLLCCDINEQMDQRRTPATGNAPAWRTKSLSRSPPPPRR